jgi:hypothetical protein
MTEKMTFSIAKPTKNTPYHIDFNWWNNHDREYKVILRGLLSEEDIQTLDNIGEDIQLDVVDPRTAEVSQVDGLLHVLMTKTAKQEGFLSENTALTEAIFRLLLINANQPLTAEEIGERLGRDPRQILRIIIQKRTVTKTVLL